MKLFTKDKSINASVSIGHFNEGGKFVVSRKKTKSVDIPTHLKVDQLKSFIAEALGYPKYPEQYSLHHYDGKEYTYHTVQEFYAKCTSRPRIYISEVGCYKK